MKMKAALFGVAFIFIFIGIHIIIWHKLVSQ